MLAPLPPPPPPLPPLLQSCECVSSTIQVSSKWLLILQGCLLLCSIHASLQYGLIVDLLHGSVNGQQHLCQHLRQEDQWTQLAWLVVLANLAQ